MGSSLRLDHVGVLVTSGEGFGAMSDRSRVDLLNGFDPVMVLEAASTVLAEVEHRDDASLLQRLPLADRFGLTKWRERMHREDARPASPIIHPLSILAATTLALSQSAPGHRGDLARATLADLITRVGLRFNDDVAGVTVDSDDDVLRFLCRAALWKEVDANEWTIWSGELVRDLPTIGEAAPVLDAFRSKYGLSFAEWWCRGSGEVATRTVHGARSWSTTAERVPASVERGWQALTTTSVGSAVSAARSGIVSHRGVPLVADVFDLGWLARTPTVETDDGRRFALWRGGLSRVLLPAVAAQVLADSTGTDYRSVAALFGKAGEARLRSALSATELAPDEHIVNEWDLPSSGAKRGDLVFVRDDVLVGCEFTLATPTRALSSGDARAVDDITRRHAAKFEQLYSSFRAIDPAHRRRWIPLLVFESPSVVDPLLNSRIHRHLLATSVIAHDEPDELLSCHSPWFLDLLELARTNSTSVMELIVAWRDGSRRGTSLDHWLADRGAFGISTRKRSTDVTDWIMHLLEGST